VRVPQVFGLVRIYHCVSTDRMHDLEQVRCLNCRQVYDKPVNGSTAGRNPGCPVCGYVGWLSVLVPVAKPIRPISAA
jgi:hypothetical protein